MTREPCIVSAFSLNPRRIGGTEVYCRELSRQLAELGWTSVLCFDGEPPAVVRSFLEAPNVVLEQVSGLGGNRLPSARELVRTVRKYRPQIVHLHYTGLLAPYQWAAWWGGAGRVYLTHHLSPEEGFAPQAAPPWKRWVFRAVNYPLSGVVCPSEYGRSSLSAMRLLPPQYFHTIYNATDLDRAMSGEDRAARFRQDHRIPPERRLVVQVGTLGAEKGVFDLLAAARMVVAQNPSAHFVLAGDGPAAEECRREAGSLGIGEHVTLTGVLEDVCASGVYDAADICCLVSRWQEMFGFTLVEAMAFECPIVATRVGGIPEVVADGQSGHLVERGDVEAMANRISSLLADTDQRSRMGKAGRRRVAELFDVRKNVAELIDWYGIAEDG